MKTAPEGSFYLFQTAGISVFLHWSWLLVAWFEIQSRALDYASMGWNIAEYLTLFCIVLLHEFGHALACRQVGGTADTIVLWPLGGIAYVAPPPRPGALLWSIAAGPLVNLLLVVPTFGLWIWSVRAGLADDNPDAAHFLLAMAIINFVLLIFNLLPIYPLDGGQILQALLWFVMGRASSLKVASGIGVVGAIGLVGLALSWRDWWLVLVAFFVGTRAWAGLTQARLLSEWLAGPRHAGFACPSCGSAPLQGEFWKCECGATFDTFAQQAVCPQCSARFEQTSCPECHHRHPLAQWVRQTGTEESSKEIPQKQ
jgi:Zn-dependent protease